MKYKVYFNGSVSEMQDNATAIDSHDLHVLCKVAHDYACILCDGDCNSCKLGLSKVFTHVFSEDRSETSSWAALEFKEG